MFYHLSQTASYRLTNIHVHFSKVTEYLFGGNGYANYYCLASNARVHVLHWYVDQTLVHSLKGLLIY